MTRQVRTPLVLAALLTVALVGIPALLTDRGEAGALDGVVVDGRGYGVSDAAVFLFSEEHLQLFEQTHTDGEGAFAFQLTPARPRVFVRPQPSHGLVPAWSATSEELTSRLAFVLQPARPITVSVQDEQGDPLQSAEVRVYDHRGHASVVGLADTDVLGQAKLDAPATADLAVFAPLSRLPRWRFSVSIPAGGTSFAFRLPRARFLSGQVLDEGGPLTGIVLVAREEGSPEDGFGGFTVTDELGYYRLPVAEGSVRMRVVDPGLKHLPATRTVRTEEAQVEALDFVLERGAELMVRTTRAGLPLVSRVWSWSPEAETWSWGGRTNGMGRVTIPVSARYAIHAQPLDPSFPTLQAWDVPYENGSLLLEADPGR